MKQKELDTKTFGELLKSVREGGAIMRGERKPSRSFVVEASGVRAIRERTSLSQSEFATLIGVSVKTLQNWEQDRRRPTGPAAALLQIRNTHPAFAGTFHFSAANDRTLALLWEGDGRCVRLDVDLTQMSARVTDAYAAETERVIWRSTIET